MKDLACKMSLEEVVPTGLEMNEADGSLTTGLLFDLRELLVEVVNELRAIRAHHCHLPWPETLVELEAKANAGDGKGGGS